MNHGVFNRKGIKRLLYGVKERSTRLNLLEKTIISLIMKQFPNILKIVLVIFGLTFAADAKACDQEKIILAMGDSLMAGYNLPPGAGFPEQLNLWLTQNGANVRVLNSGVSGDTTAGGLSRLDWALASIPGGMPDLLILEFGGNDMLRGIDPTVTRQNMDAILKALAEKGVPVLVMGMRAPPNMGPEFEQEFNAIFPELAEKYGAELYPFYLEGVAANPDLNLQDGIHPNEEGIIIMVNNAGPFILDLIQD